MKKILLLAGCMICAAGAPRVANAAPTLGPVSNAAEIRAAAAKAAPGDTILMADGTWTDADIFFEAQGTAEAPITLQAANPGKVVLSGKSQLHIGGQWLVVDGLKFTNGFTPGKAVVEFRANSSRLAAHCRLTNCAIVDYNPPDLLTTYMWVAVYGQYNRVDRCWFSGMNHKGVLLTVIPVAGGPPNFTQIERNYFGDRARGPDNGYETMRIGTSEVSMQVSRATVEGNYFIHCDGEMEIISNKTCENVYRGNTFVDNKGQLTLRHGKRCRVEGNFFFGYNVSNASGVRIIDEGHVVVNNYFGGLKGTKARGAVVLANGIPNSPLHEYFQVKNALIAFNTFVDCRDNIVIGLEGTKSAILAPANCTIANNLVLGKTGPLIDIVSAPVKMTYEGNIIFGAEAGVAATDGIKLIDPKLVQGVDKLFRPGPDSPALNAAAGAYPGVTEDMDGQARADGRPDVGADERSDAPAARRPLTPGDVGPEWMR